MGRRSWLDSIVYRFQHNWETNPQYRAAVSGVVGLVLILSLCTCMGVLNRTAGAALAAVGLGTGDAGPLGTPNTGTNRVGCCNSFPTPTVLYPTNGPPPLATVPESQTPPPYPTATDVPTATDTPTPGGGGGGGTPSCSGGRGNITWVISNPCPAVHGQAVTLTITARQYAGQQMQLDISFGTCSDGCAWVYSPTTVPASGIWTATRTLPQDASGPIQGSFFFNGVPAILIVGPNVQ